MKQKDLISPPKISMKKSLSNEKNSIYKNFEIFKELQHDFYDNETIIKQEDSILNDKINEAIKETNKNVNTCKEIEAKLSEQTNGLYGNIISIMSVFVSIIIYLFVGAKVIESFFANNTWSFLESVKYFSLFGFILIIFNFCLVYLIKKSFYKDSSSILTNTKENLTFKNFWYQILYDIFEYKMYFISSAVLLFIFLSSILIDQTAGLKDKIFNNYTLPLILIIITVIIQLITSIYAYKEINIKLASRKLILKEGFKSE